MSLMCSGQSFAYRLLLMFSCWSVPIGCRRGPRRGKRNDYKFGRWDEL